MQSKWLIKNIKYDYKGLSSTIGLPEEICRCLINRCPGSLEEIRDYLEPDLSKLHDPSLLKDMDVAMDMILSAIEEEKRIRLVGDFDIDGSMSIFVALSALRKAGAQVDYEIPDRIRDGYGINKDIVQQAKEDGVDLIITFDNGISAMEAVAHAKEIGLEIIVTDHHDVPYILENAEKKEVLPPADAVVNPKREECTYPYKMLCGAAVAYKLVSQLYHELGIPEEELREYIPFVAIATVGDIVDLTGENRIIVKHGLEMLKMIKNEGLLALAEASKVDIQNISTYIIGFVLGPCFNAAGRLSTAKMTVDLLFAEGERAKSLARELYELNQTRRAMTDEGMILAEEEIRNHKREEDQVIVVKLPDVHESLAGIIAGRVKERYYRPTIVLTKTENGLKGSARSIEEYNIFEGLNHSKDYLTRFGGHPMAAGLSMDEDKLDSFREDLKKKANLGKEDLYPKVTIDARLNPAVITEKFVESLEKLEPFGKANPKPIFAEKNLLIHQVYLMGRDKDHMKLIFNVDGIYVEGVYFYGVRHIRDYLREVHGIEAGDLSQELKNRRCDILYYPDINTYNGTSKIQLKITDFRIA